VALVRELCPGSGGGLFFRFFFPQRKIHLFFLLLTCIGILDPPTRFTSRHVPLQFGPFRLTCFSPTTRYPRLLPQTPHPPCLKVSKHPFLPLPQTLLPLPTSHEPVSNLSFPCPGVPHHPSGPGLPGPLSLSLFPIPPSVVVFLLCISCLRSCFGFGASLQVVSLSCFV